MSKVVRLTLSVSPAISRMSLRTSSQVTHSARPAMKIGDGFWLKKSMRTRLGRSRANRCLRVSWSLRGIIGETPPPSPLPVYGEGEQEQTSPPGPLSDFGEGEL